MNGHIDFYFSHSHAHTMCDSNLGQKSVLLTENSMVFHIKSRNLTGFHYHIFHDSSFMITYQYAE